MRHVATFVIVTVLTAVGVLWWLHDGDLVEAVTPAVIARDPE